MKKVVVFFLIAAIMFSFYTAYKQADNDEIQKMENVEKITAREFVIPNDPLLADPDEFYPILFKAANASKINIFRTNVNFRPDNQVQVLKYVLLTDNTHYFDHFKIKSGRKLSVKDTQQSNFFLSTTNTNDLNQIGVIKEFGDNQLVTIKPLKASYHFLPVDGRYFTEVSDDKRFNTFLGNFSEEINAYYKKYNNKIAYTPKDFRGNLSYEEYSSTSSLSYLTYSKYIIFIIIFFLLIYDIFNQSKKIGIIKMHGVSNMRLWFTVVGRMITITFALSSLVLLIMAIWVKNTTYTFIYNILLDQFVTFIIIIALSLVSYFYISKVEISQTIKNRNDSNGIFMLNTLLKVVCSILLLSTVVSIFNQYTEISAKQKNEKNWEHSKDYGIFYPKGIGYDQDDVQNGAPKMNSVINGELYPILNQMGSVLINAREYEETALRLNKNYDGIRSVKVNNNYLREFPVYDIHHNPVKVSEDKKAWILLVPAKYKSKEKEILNFFVNSRKSVIQAEQETLRREVPNYIKNQQIELIWLANDQKIFSFNPEVFKTENNMIIDPIIQVVTEKNSVSVDRDSILGGGNTDPLKIKLINRDTLQTYKALKSELKRMKLNDNLKYLVTVDQFALQKIYDLQKRMNQLLLISSGLLVGVFFLISQNLILFFYKNQQKFVVHRLFGIGFFRTYKQYILLFSVTWIIQILISLIINRSVNIKFLAAATILICIEIIASIIALMVIEHRNKIKVLKGG